MAAPLKILRKYYVNIDFSQMGSWCCLYQKLSVQLPMKSSFYKYN